jgi:hypothetical protein
MRWAQFVAPLRRQCWMAPPQFNRTSIRRFHTLCRNRPRCPFHREVRGRYLGQQVIEPFEEHDRPEGLRVSKRRRPCHRRTLRCPRICAVARTGRIAPLNLAGLTAAQMSLLAQSIILFGAANWSLSGEERTWRVHRKSVANDPQRPFAARLRCNAT